MNSFGTDDGLRLAELLATRLCHDLSSPLNGLSAGLAEAVGNPENAADGLTLAQDATRVAVARLFLLRAAWGEPSESLDRNALHRLCAGLPGRRIHVDLSGIAETVTFSPQDGRLLLNILILCAESLPRGGTVMLQGDAQRGVIAMIDGPQAAWPEGLPGLIAAPESALAQLRDMSPRTIQGPLTVLMAASAGQRVSLLLGAAAETTPPLLVSLTSA